MARTTVMGTGGEIHWERLEHRPTPTYSTGADAGRERPSFLSLFLPLAALAIGSILAVGAIAAALVGLLTLVV